MRVDKPDTTGIAGRHQPKRGLTLRNAPSRPLLHRVRDHRGRSKQAVRRYRSAVVQVVQVALDAFANHCCVIADRRAATGAAICRITCLTPAIPRGRHQHA